MIVSALITLAAIPSTPVADVYEVTDSRRESHFAGRLGHRIEDSLTVTRDGRTYTVTIGRRHTRFEKRPHQFRAGDRVHISGAVRGNRIMVLPGDIRPG
jgi:hypothetical protein